MKKLNYIVLLLLSLSVFSVSCNDANKTNVTDKEVEATEVAESSSTLEDIEKYKEEITNLRNYMKAIDTKINSSEKDPKDGSIKGEKQISISDYTNEQDQLIKREIYIGEMGDQGYTMYFKEGNESEIVYSRYFDRENSEVDPNGTSRTILIELINTGSLDENKENKLILVNYGTTLIEGEKLQKYTAMYEEIKKDVASYK